LEIEIGLLANLVQTTSHAVIYTVYIGTKEEHIESQATLQELGPH